jgi:16S rRNA (guanine1516-N2)-methyltransferase
MVSEIRLFTESTFLEKAQSYQTVLSLRGVVVNI